MFAPNRLITAKEQWLLAAIIAAVLAGSGTLYFYGRSPGSDHDPFVDGGKEASTVLPVVSPEVPDSKIATVPLPPMVTPAAEQAVPVATLPDVPAQQDAGVTSQPVPAEEVPVTPAVIGVAAMGAVVTPGLYWVPADYRVADLITRAGGATVSADLSEIALTARLIDETTLTIPEKAEHRAEDGQVSARRGVSTCLLNPAPYLKRYAQSYREPSRSRGLHAHREKAEAPSASASGTGGSEGSLINVNTATASQLQELPGIGAVLSAAIVAERERQPFADVDDLDRVPGIGEKRLAAIRALVTAP